MFDKIAGRVERERERESYSFGASLKQRSSYFFFRAKRTLPALFLSALAISFCIPPLSAFASSSNSSTQNTKAQATLTQASDPNANSSVAPDPYTPADDAFYNGVDLGATGKTNCIPTLKNTTDHVVTDGELTITVPAIPGTPKPSVVATASSNLKQKSDVQSTTNADVPTASVTYGIVKALEPGEELKGEAVFSALTGATDLTDKQLAALFMQDEDTHTLTIAYEAQGGVEIEEEVADGDSASGSAVSVLPTTGDSSHTLPQILAAITFVAFAVCLVVYVIYKKKNAVAHKTFVALIALVVATGALSFASLTNKANAFIVTEDTETFTLSVDNKKVNITFNANGGTYITSSGIETSEVMIRGVYNGTISASQIPTMKEDSAYTFNKNYYTEKAWTTESTPVTFPLTGIGRTFLNTTLYAGVTVNGPGDFFLAPSDRYWDNSVDVKAFVDNTYDASTNPHGYEPGVLPDAQEIIKTQAQLTADKAILHNPQDPNYESTLAEYKGFMNEDKVHLYVKLNYTPTGDYTKDDAYLEARIIQVGPHNYNKFPDTGSASPTETDIEDGSALTFQAVHALPEAYKMAEDSSTYKNYCIWAKSPLTTQYNTTKLYDAMNNPGGSIASLFPESFIGTDGIVQAVPKTSFQFKDSSDQPVNIGYTINQKLWIASMFEMGGQPTGAWSTDYKEEGTQYAYLTDKVGSQSTSGNALYVSNDTSGGIAYTRSKHAPGIFQASSWWERSALDSTNGRFCNVNPAGDVTYIKDAFALIGVVPCFCF